MLATVFLLKVDEYIKTFISVVFYFCKIDQFGCKCDGWEWDATKQSDNFFINII